MAKSNFIFIAPIVVFIQMHTSAGIKNLFTEKFFDFGPQILVNDFFPLKIAKIFAVAAIIGDKCGFDFFLINRERGCPIIFAVGSVLQFSAGSLDKIVAVIHNHKFNGLVKFFLQSG